MEFYKSDGETEIMGIQPYCLRIVYVFINNAGIFMEMVTLLEYSMLYGSYAEKWLSFALLA